MDLGIQREPQRRGSRSWGVRIGAALGLTLIAVATAGAGAGAAPSPSPSRVPEYTIQIEDVHLTEPLVISSITQRRLYDQVRSEIDYMTSGPGVTRSPDGEKLGIKVTILLATDGTAKQAYDLYPLAAGGPRAFRPNKQPDGRKVGDAWFYGRLSMPNTLRAAGVPIEAGAEQVVVPIQGGQGGGVEESASPQAVSKLFGDWQRVVRLNSALVLVLAAVVFGLAYLVRRRI